MSKSYKNYLKKIKPDEIDLNLNKPSCFFCNNQEEPFFIVEFKETPHQGYRICDKCHKLYDTEDGRDTLLIIVKEFENTRKEIIKKHGITEFENIGKEVDKNLDDYFKGKSE